MANGTLEWPLQENGIHSFVILNSSTNVFKLYSSILKPTEYNFIFISWVRELTNIWVGRFDLDLSLRARLYSSVNYRIYAGFGNRMPPFLPSPRAAIFIPCCALFPKHLCSRRHLAPCHAAVAAVDEFF
jgi:hypothetical protein